MPAPGDKSGLWRADTGRPRRHPCPCGPAGNPFVTSLVKRRWRSRFEPGLHRVPHCKVDVLPSTLAGNPPPLTSNFADICFDYSIRFCVGYRAPARFPCTSDLIVYPLSILRYPASTQRLQAYACIPGSGSPRGSPSTLTYYYFGSIIAGLTGFVCLSRLRCFY